MTLPDFLIDHPDGEIRFVGSRISLELVARSFRAGYSAEMILDSYPTLSLLNIYRAIVFYLENRNEVDVLIDDVDRLTGEFEAKHKPRIDIAELRRRLEDRTKAQVLGPVA